MGKRLNISQPTVLSTVTSPLSDYLEILASDTLEQWFYANTGDYSPDRTTTPLELTPRVTAVDVDSSMSYTPSFYTVKWYYLDPTNNTDYTSSNPYWPGLHWVPINAVSGGTGVDYYCPTSNNPSYKLYVTKNVPAANSQGSSGGQDICCVVVYQDPRDNSVLTVVREKVSLTTNQDADASNLQIEMLSPTKVIFNPLAPPIVSSLETTLFDFKVKVRGQNNADVTANYYIEWSAHENESATEVLINTLPCYTQATQKTNKGQGKDTITIDAMFVESLHLICRVKTSSTSQALPPVAYSTLVWKFPKVEAITVCETGEIVDSNNRTMIFSTTVNTNKEVLSENKAKEHLRFNYKRRVSSSSTYTNMGWGYKVTENSSAIRQTSTGATPVHSEVYMLGQYEAVTMNGEAITYGGVPIYERKV